MENTKKEIIEEIEILIRSNKDNPNCDEYWLAEVIRDVLKRHDVSGASVQAFEPTYAVCKPASNGLKLQARGHKLQDPGTRVQAHKLRVRGTSNKDK